MKEAARTTAIVLYALALVALIAGLVLPMQSGTATVAGGGTGDISAGLVVVSTTVTPANGTATTTAGNWFSSENDGYAGVGLVRAAAPLMGVGALALVAGLVLVAVRRRLVSGILGSLGAALAILGVVLGVIGMDRFFAAELLPAGMSFSYAFGFHVAVFGLLAAAAAAAFAFIAVAESQAGPARANLPRRPAISVEDPYAFNPLASQEARPFKADAPEDLRGFEVTGGNRPFRADPKPEPAPAKPAGKPAQPKPGGAPKPAPPKGSA